MRRPQMMWQAARVILNPAHPEEIGKTFWVSGRTQHRGRDLDTNVSDERDCFMTNLTDDGSPVGYYADWVELLPDFAEDVPRVPFTEWSSRT